MEHLSTQVEHQQIEWRKAKVLELSSQGHSQREIALSPPNLFSCSKLTRMVEYHWCKHIRISTKTKYLHQKKPNLSSFWQNKQKWSGGGNGGCLGICRSHLTTVDSVSKRDKELLCV
jgi:hypothetical protein